MLTLDERLHLTVFTEGLQTCYVTQTSTGNRRAGRVILEKLARGWYSVSFYICHTQYFTATGMCGIRGPGWDRRSEPQDRAASIWAEGQRSVRPDPLFSLATLQLSMNINVLVLVASAALHDAEQ